MAFTEILRSGWFAWAYVAVVAVAFGIFCWCCVEWTNDPRSVVEANARHEDWMARVGNEGVK